MKHTRETSYAYFGYNKATDKNTSPRFKVGDKALVPYKGKVISQTVNNVFWDEEFGGWLVCCYLIGIHEQNFIHESERDDWIPHEDGLWSWWEKKE